MVDKFAVIECFIDNVMSCVQSVYFGRPFFTGWGFSSNICNAQHFDGSHMFKHDVCNCFQVI